MVEVGCVEKVYDGRFFVALGGDEFRSDHDEINYRLYHEDYVVNINGVDHPARDCRVSRYPFNQPWPGHQRDFAQSESAAFISIYADEPLQLRVKPGVALRSPVVRPLSRQVEVAEEDGAAVFALTRHGHYVFEPADEHSALHIFYERPRLYADSDRATYCFGPGMHFPGTIRLKDHESVYVDKHAVVFGSIYADGAEDIRIFGGGTLDNTCEERLTENCYEPYTKGPIRLYRCKHVRIEDVILTNASTWVISVFDSDDITIDNVKIVGHWRYNTDGIDIVNTSNVRIQNSFIRSFDDTITLKAIYRYDKSIENITVDNCVLWCGWGKNCEVGVETDAPEYRHIVFQNCDLIHNSSAALDINNGCGSAIHDITFENLHVEYQPDMQTPMMQTSSQESYQDAAEPFVPDLIYIHNAPYPIRQKTPEGVVRMACETPGQVYDVMFRHIHVHLPEAQTLVPKISVRSIKPEIAHKNIVIDGLYVNGVAQSDLCAHFAVIQENTEPIRLITPGK